MPGDDERRQGFPGGQGTPTLGAVFRLSTGDGSDLKKYLKALSEQKFLSGNARSAFANLLSQADETFASIMGTFKEPLNAWINPMISAPSVAPVRLPMPPSTAAVKASSPIWPRS